MRPWGWREVNGYQSNLGDKNQQTYVRDWMGVREVRKKEVLRMTPKILYWEMGWLHQGT